MDVPSPVYESRIKRQTPGYVNAVALAEAPISPNFPFSRLREKVAEGRMRVYLKAMTTRIVEPKRLDQARRLRRDQTPAEIRLWSGLRGRRLQKHKFVRQRPVGPFTVDFLCRGAALVIEVDGATHSDERDIDYDKRRTDYLKSQGYRVLRIQNDDIYHRFDDVMDMILLALQDKLPQD